MNNKTVIEFDTQPHSLAVKYWLKIPLILFYKMQRI